MLTRDELRRATPLDRVDLPGVTIESGKVRDSIPIDHRRVIVTTDRVSAFDRVLATIPYKGQVLNQLSAWWFERTADIVPNHLIEVIDPNAMLVREARPLPVEVVVRGFITGVTSTSLWTLYAAGDRAPYGIALPDRLQRDDPLPTPIITPTTKGSVTGHDERLTRDQVLSRGLVAPRLWRRVEAVALALFERGQTLAREAGLTLVDTKYEFGLIDDRLTLIDECHTPDSSRFWDRDKSHYDKEFLRRWFADRGYRGDGAAPVMPDEFVAEVARRYIAVLERLCGTPFVPGAAPARLRVARAVTALTGLDVRR